MTAYYNEIDPYAAQWLRNLIAAGHIAPGEVDERSIVDVQPDDLKGYVQCHFFAGIGGWSYGARLAGWPDDRPLWTGSCPCQPFSVAGKGEGKKDDRHLWPAFFALIRARRPDVVMGEQVAAAVGKDWLDGVHSDLESIGYATGAAVIPACAVDAPHRRDRLWFVADASSERRDRVDALLREDVPGWHSTDLHEATWSSQSSVADTRIQRRQQVAGRAHGHESSNERRPEDDDYFSPGDVQGSLEKSEHGRRQRRTAAEPGVRPGAAVSPSQKPNSNAWSGAEWLFGADGKLRRFEPRIQLLAHGVPARVGKLRAYGNAIVPQIAAEVIGAYMEIAA